MTPFANKGPLGRSAAGQAGGKDRYRGRVFQAGAQSRGKAKDLIVRHADQYGEQRAGRRGNQGIPNDAPASGFGWLYVRRLLHLALVLNRSCSLPISYLSARAVPRLPHALWSDFKEG